MGYKCMKYQNLTISTSEAVVHPVHLVKIISRSIKLS